MKIKLFIPHALFCTLLATFLILVFLYEEKVNKNKIIACNKLNFELSKSLLPKNFSSINIALDFVDKRKWTQLIFNNHQSYFKKGYFSNNESAKALITITLKNNINCALLAKVKPHGDLEDHHIPPTKLPSMQVYLEGGHFFGIVKFLLLRPKTRTSIDDEITAATIIKEMDFLSPRTAKATLKYNNKKINFIFQEKVVKEFIEHNGYREGLLFSNDDRLHYYQNNDPLDVNYYKISNSKIVVKNNQYLDSLSKLNILNKKRKHLEKFLNKGAIVTPGHVDLNLMYNGFFNETFFAFDVLQLALNSEHSIFYDNRRIYYDFMNKKFLPIYYDGMAELFPYIKAPIKKNLNINKGALTNFKKYKNIEKKILAKKLIDLGVSKTEKEILVLLNKIQERLIYLSSNIESGPTMYLDYKKLKKNEYNNIGFYKAIFLNINKLFICDSNELNCENLNINDQDVQELLSQNYKYKNLPVILIDKFDAKNKMNFYDKSFRKKNYVKVKIDKFNLILLDDISYRYDKKLRKLTLIKKSLQGRALINNNSILENINIEIFDKSIISGINAPKNYLVDKYGFTGCLTIYDTRLKNVKIKASNSKCEDAINIVRSRGEISNLNIVASESDAFDADFSNISISNLKVDNAKNDCIDFSGGSYFLNKLVLNNCSDKGLSAENSNIIVNNISISDSLYGIASKDFSNVNVKKILLDNVTICWDAYSKKQEFGGGKISINNFQSKSLCKPQENIDEGSKIEFSNVF